MKRLSLLGNADRLTVGGIVLAYLLLSSITFNQIEEDAYIYFRIAANIADGYGYVFNRGGPPVEAASSFLWLLLIALLYKLPGNIEILSKLLGCFFGVLCLLVVARIGQHHIRNRALRHAPTLLTAVSTPFIMGSQRGLETPLYLFLILVLVSCCMQAKMFRYWAISAALLLPARPEGFFVLLALIPVLWIRREHDHQIRKSVLVLATIALALLAARVIYFHDLAPSPFYIKMQLGSPVGWQRLCKYVTGSYIYVLALPLALTAWKKSFWAEERIVLGSFAVVVVAWSVIANDYMPYHRHLLPAIPLTYLLISAALDDLIGEMSRPKTTAAFGFCLFYAAGSLIFGSTVGYFNNTDARPIRKYVAHLLDHPIRFFASTARKIGDPMHVGYVDEGLGTGDSPIGIQYPSRVGAFIQANYPYGTVVIYDQMGQTPFRAGLDKIFIDSFGLTDRTIGYYRFKCRADRGLLLRTYDAILDLVRQRFDPDLGLLRCTRRALDYLFDADADLILVNRFLADVFPRSLPSLIRNDPRFEQRYDLSYQLESWVSVYEKKGTGPDEIRVPDGLGIEIKQTSRGMSLGGR